jgi:uncharacterized membrane protein
MMLLTLGLTLLIAGFITIVIGVTEKSTIHLNAEEAAYYLYPDDFH